MHRCVVIADCAADGWQLDRARLAARADVPCENEEEAGGSSDAFDMTRNCALGVPGVVVVDGGGSPRAHATTRLPDTAGSRPS